jgi:hypothetical protein
MELRIKPLELAVGSTESASGSKSMKFIYVLAFRWA